MKKFIICMIIILLLTGCGEEKNDGISEEEYETFGIGTTLDNDRHVVFSFNVPYKNTSLDMALLKNEISLEEVISKLSFQSSANDGGSKLYRYNKVNKTFGNEDFYLLECHSFDNDKDVYIAKKVISLTDKCITKIDDLDGVSMRIKDGTLTNAGTTIIITDTTNRNNIYGEEYRIDKYVDNNWVPLIPIIDNYAWTSKGYTKDENNELVFNINWEWLYGKLNNGKYRIVKSTSKPVEGTVHYITVEFVIE